MPKELTHIMFAHEVAMQTSKHILDRQAQAALRDFPEALYLGSIIVDSPLYTLHNPETAVIAAIHHGNSPFSSTAGLVALSQHIEHRHHQSKMHKLALALLIGAVLHRVLDTHFHPWIFAITGANLEAHIELEAALDGYMVHSYRGRHGVPFVRTVMGSGKIQQMVKKLRKAASELDMLVSSYFEASFADRYIPQIDNTKHRDGSSLHHRMIQILADHTRIQKLFFSRGIRLCLCLAALALPRLRAHRNLCYSWRRATYGSIFKKNIAYSDPVDGTYRSHTVKELYHAACESGYQIVREIIDSTQSPNISLSDTINNWKLNNLCHGADERLPLHHNTAFYMPQHIMRR